MDGELQRHNHVVLVNLIKASFLFFWFEFDSTKRLMEMFNRGKMKERERESAKINQHGITRSATVQGTDH